MSIVSSNDHASFTAPGPAERELLVERSECPGRLSDFHHFPYFYLGTNCRVCFVPTRETREARQIIWDFKEGKKQRKVIDMVVPMISAI